MVANPAESSKSWLILVNAGDLLFRKASVDLESDVAEFFCV